MGWFDSLQWFNTERLLSDSKNMRLLYNLSIRILLAMSRTREVGIAADKLFWKVQPMLPEQFMDVVDVLHASELLTVTDLSDEIRILNITDLGLDTCLEAVIKVV